MKNVLKIATIVALSATFATVAHADGHKKNHGHYNNSTVIQVVPDHIQPYYTTKQVITGSTTVCENYVIQGNDNRLLGTIIGGVIGHQVEHGAGTVIGGIIGHEIGRNTSDRGRVERRCNGVPVYETQQEFQYYQVYYNINGDTRMTRMHYKPDVLTIYLYPNLHVENGF